MQDLPRQFGSLPIYGDGERMGEEINAAQTGPDLKALVGLVVGNPDLERREALLDSTPDGSRVKCRDLHRDVS